MPWVELKRYDFYQDEVAPFPLDLEVGLQDLQAAIGAIDNELTDNATEWKFDSKGRRLCPKYYNHRFQKQWKSHGFGAYTTWWTIEGWYDDESSE